MLVLLMHSAFAAVNPPVLKCVSVDELGNTLLTWEKPVDPANEFLNYKVFISDTKSGPYTSINVSGLNTTTYMDNVNKANISSFYYYLVSVYDDGSGVKSSMASDTGKSILPIFTVVSDSTAKIEWNPVFDPNTTSSAGVYSIYRRIGANSFTRIGTTNYGTETYSDKFKVCSEVISYRIEISDANGCVSKSSVLSDLFEDRTPPATPVYDSITVDGTSQKVVMGWEPSTSLDTEGYLVLYWTKSPPSYSIRDTVWGINNTSFTESLAAIDPALTWEQFTVTAFDSCRHPSANTSAAADDQRTMNLNYTLNTCENTVALSWTPYINWLDLDSYEILVSVNGGSFKKEASVSSTDTIYTYKRTNNLASYCYKIKAVNTLKTRSSTSNSQCVSASSVVVPAMQYFKKISVQNNRDVYIESLTDATLPVSQYVLYRSLEELDNFFEVARIPFDNSSIIEMNDLNANVDQTSYYYRIGVEDTCGNLMFLSDPASSIFLKGVMDESTLEVELSWNEYLGWQSVSSSVEEYAVNLITDGYKTQVGSVAKGVTNFSFLLEDEITEGANFCFEIEAREASGNKFSQRDTVFSNQVCFTENLKVFVPNAFRPNGANPVFLPVLSFGDVSTYHIIIYDKWGGKVFETDNINEGWNGTVNGKLAEFGAYVYHLEVANFTGANYIKGGTFVLLR